MESPASPLHTLTALELAAAIRARAVSCLEVMQAFWQRIEALNPGLNALVSLLPAEAAFEAARAADRALARGAPVGLLHGLPIAIKDLMDVAGMRTSHGTTLHPEHVAAQDCLMVQKLKAAGAIIIGKTNTPEHGLGTLTFNDVFGTTVNPWDRTRHAGGSSGGAAAAVAARLLPFADGSDSGGSIRYPAAFCNLLGLRPTPGRVPTGRRGDGWSPHGVLGPIARNARDAGLLLAALAGADAPSPIALTDDPTVFARIEPSRLRGVRIAWSRTVAGLPIDPAVTSVLEKTRAQLIELGCLVEDVEPDLGQADECWEVIEMHEFLAYCDEDVRAHAAVLRPDLVRNVEQGRALSPSRIAWAHAVRTELYRRTAQLLERYDLLALPATPVAAPPADVEWVKEIDGTRLSRYFEWQRCATRITVTAHPALSMPAGFTAAGLPVGLQLVGRYRGEAALLGHAAAYEDAAGWTRRAPPAA